MTASTISLLEASGLVLIVAHREDTTLLESTLRGERFEVRAMRGPYAENQLTWSAAARCLANHANAWREAARRQMPTVVVEADFVPVRDFGSALVPRCWTEGARSGFAWLYSAGSVLYGLTGDGRPFGHGNTTVAYMTSPHAAQALLRFYEREIARNPHGLYSAWETRLGPYLRWECGIRNYLPTYQFGEHGGLASAEHARNGIRPWHQADVLLHDLAFMPAYAEGSRFKFALYRARAIARGWLRFAMLKTFNPRHLNPESAQGPVRIAWFSLRRLAHCA